MSYDSKCEEIAEHFLRDAGRLDLKSELAQLIQDEIERFISYGMPPVATEARKLDERIRRIRSLLATDTPK